MSGGVAYGAVAGIQTNITIQGAVSFDLRNPFDPNSTRVGALVTVVPGTGAETDIGYSQGVTAFWSAADNVSQLTGQAFAVGVGGGMPVGLDASLAVDMTKGAPNTISAGVHATQSVSPVDITPAQVSWTHGRDATIQQTWNTMKLAYQIISRAVGFAIRVANARSGEE